MTLVGRFGACPIQEQRTGHLIGTPREERRSGNEPDDHQLDRQGIWLLCASSSGGRCTTDFDTVLSLNITCFSQATSQRCHEFSRASADVLLRKPITGIADCCARAASGHAAAAPPSSDMNSRCFTARCLPCVRPKGSHTPARRETAALRDFNPAYDRLGSSTSFQVRSRHDRFTPMNGHSSGDRFVRVVPTRRHRLAIRSPHRRACS